MEGTNKFCDYPCPSTQFLYANSSCLTSCQTLFSQRIEGTYKFCDYPCTSGQYLYANGSCITTCQTLFNQRTEGTNKFCDYPCTSGQYLYANSSCMATCQALFKPRTEGIYKFCDYPCPSTQFLYPNNSCIATCQTSFSIRMEGTNKFCDYPCLSTQFLYANSSCLTSCQTLFSQRTELTYKFCDYPCTSGQYLYANGSCIATCQTQFNQRTEGTNKFCDYPCPSTQFSDGCSFCITGCASCNTANPNRCLVCKAGYFKLENGTCSTACAFPFIEVLVGSDKYCTSPGSSKPASPYLNSLAQVSVKSLSINALISNILFANTPIGYGVSGCIKILPYIRYLEIDYPENLERVLNSLNSSFLSFSLGIPISANIQDKFTKHQLPAKFDLYQWHSSFIVNYWQTATSLLFFLGFIVLVWFLSQITKKFPFWISFFDRLMLIVRWNFFMMIVCGNFDAVIIATSLELRTFYLSSNRLSSAVSLCFCLLMNVVILCIIALAAYVVKDLRKKRNQVCPTSLTHHHYLHYQQQTWRKVQLFYLGYKDESSIQHFFMSVFLIRLYIFNLIVAHMFAHPLLQTCLITTINICMIAYVLRFKPFKSKIVFWQVLLDEVGMLGVNTSVLILAIFDTRRLQLTSEREEIGLVIIIINISLSIIDNLFLVAYLCSGAKDAYEKTKKHKAGGITAWLTVLLSPFEAVGMDLDTMVIMEKFHGQKKLSRKESELRLSNRHQISIKSDIDLNNNSNEEMKYEINCITSQIGFLQPRSSRIIARMDRFTRKPQYDASFEKSANNQVVKKSNIEIYGQTFGLRLHDSTRLREASKTFQRKIVQPSSTQLTSLVDTFKLKSQHRLPSNIDESGIKSGGDE